MLEHLFASPAARTLVQYLITPETRLAVIVPGIASLAILIFYARQGKISRRLQLLWVLTLGVSFCCARWEVTEEVQQLYSVRFFSISRMVLSISVSSF